MKNSSKYLLIAGGIALGLAGGIAIGVSEADEIRGVTRIPKQIAMKVVGNEQQPLLPMAEIVTRFEQDGSRVREIELDREYLQDVYELELVDAEGREREIEVDARTGEVIKNKTDRD